MSCVLVGAFRGRVTDKCGGGSWRAVAREPGAGVGGKEAARQLPFLFIFRLTSLKWERGIVTGGMFLFLVSDNLMLCLVLDTVHRADSSN